MHSPQLSGLVLSLALLLAGEAGVRTGPAAPTAQPTPQRLAELERSVLATPGVPLPGSSVAGGAPRISEAAPSRAGEPDRRAEAGHASAILIRRVLAPYAVDPSQRLERAGLLASHLGTPPPQS